MCLRTNERAGHRCGYVRVPKEHPLFEKSYNDCDLDVHGGLTFSDYAHQEGMEEGYYLGFDCGHWGDATDYSIMQEQFKAIYQEMDKRSQELFPKFDSYRETLWTTGMVAEETERLADQLTEAK